MKQAGFGNYPVIPLQISAVRLPREPTNPERLKGFGYAEFEDIDSLFQALSLNEEVRPRSRGNSVGIKRPSGPWCHPIPGLSSLLSHGSALSFAVPREQKDTSGCCRSSSG